MKIVRRWPGAAEKLTRQELIELVKRIHAADGTEAQITTWTKAIKDNVPMSEVSDLIFWSDLTPEEVIDKALSYIPAALPGPDDS